MKASTDLCDLPFSFSQLPALSEQGFINAATERGLRLTSRELTGLHRLGLLTPFLRFAKDGRAIAAADRRGDSAIWELSVWLPTDHAGLLAARENGQLHEPATEGFRSRYREERSLRDGGRYRPSAYLYSHHQLTSLPMLRNVLPHLDYDRDGEVRGLRVHRAFLLSWRRIAAASRETAVALSALEPLYFPSAVGRISGWPQELEKLDRWGKRLRVGEMLEWLDGEATWLRDRAAALLSEADLIDPLGEWVRVLREAEPKRWEDLRGEARSAVDLRVAAEVLLGYYERLAKGRRAPPLTRIDGRGRDALCNRLRPQRGLDRVLTDFGLSPHPALILVLEGDTELLLFPRVMEHFGVRFDRDYIAIENAKGVDRDLSTLLTFAVAPQTELVHSGRYLRLVKPPTRLLVTMDAEGPYVSAASREETRQRWIDRIMLTLPAAHRTVSARESIAHMVSVETWNPKGESFEFAHFTDRRIARAIDRLDRRRRRPSPERRLQLVAQARERKANLATVGSFSKVDLAETLWPILKRKIELAQRHGTVDRIPVVRVLGRATDLAREFPRRNLVIPLVQEE